MPFGDWMEHWYETHSRPAARPGTRRIYESYIRLYIKPGIGGIPLNKLTAKDMQQFFAWLKTEGVRTNRTMKRGWQTPSSATSTACAGGHWKRQYRKT